MPAHALFKQFSSPIRALIDNRFVFSPFWRALCANESRDTRKAQFDAARKRATYAVMQGETEVIVLSYLYVLRNQLVHGGATWGSWINRARVDDGVAIRGTRVRIVIDLLLHANPDIFDNMAYPVV